MTVEAPVAAALQGVIERTGVADSRVLFDERPVVRRPRTAAEHAMGVEQLSQVLYERWFTRAGMGGTRFQPDDVVERLQRAHAETALLEPGWVVHTARPDGEIVATRSGGLTVMSPSECRNLSRDGRPCAGDSLAVVTRRHAIDASGGWWMTWSIRDGLDDPHRIRLYWH